MADKIQNGGLAQKTSVEKLTGTVTGKRFVARLDDINIGDKWDPDVLPAMVRDGLGSADLIDGHPLFVFRDSLKSTIQFDQESQTIRVAQFFVNIVDGKKS